MSVVRSDSAGVTRLAFEGIDALDTAIAPELKAVAAAALGSGRDVVVDLASVAYIDSAGVGALVSVYKAARTAGRRAVFAGAGAGVCSVLSIIRLDQIFEMAPDAGLAARSLGGAGAAP